jgi:NAD(P)H-dependent FMN reductase
MQAALEVGVILASVRDGRRGEQFAAWISALLAARAEVQTELLDLKEWAAPPYSHKDPPTVAEKSYEPTSLAGRWRDKIASKDALLIVTPEYSHGYPGALKNALDQIYAPYNHKPVAFVSYGGFASGARAVEQLRLVAIELRMVPIRDEVNVRLVGYAADERGWPKEELYGKRAAAMLDELLWMGRLLKDGRERHPR